MSPEEITISHPGYDARAQQTLRSLWSDDDFADVTLATADDQQIKAHKAILSSASPFFRNILLKHPHQSPLIYLGNMQSGQLEQVLRFIWFSISQVFQGSEVCLLWRV